MKRKMPDDAFLDFCIAFSIAVVFLIMLLLLEGKL